jgi:predicted component of type VI protein secretion system
VLTSRYATASNSSATRTAMAAVGDTPATTAVASAAPFSTPIDNAAYLSSFPNATPSATSTSPVTVASASSTADGSTAGDTSFRSLFQAGERSQPVSPAIHKLWGESSSLTSVASATPANPIANISAPQGLDLFSDRSGTFSS